MISSDCNSNVHELCLEWFKQMDGSMVRCDCDCHPPMGIGMKK